MFETTDSKDMIKLWFKTGPNIDIVFASTASLGHNWTTKLNWSDEQVDDVIRDIDIYSDGIIMLKSGWHLNNLIFLLRKSYRKNNL